MLRTEDLRADGNGTVNRVFAFLGLPPHRLPIGEFTRQRRYTIDPALRERLRSHFADDQARLEVLLEYERARWPGLRHGRARPGVHALIAAGPGAGLQAGTRWRESRAAQAPRGQAVVRRSCVRQACVVHARLLPDPPEAAPGAELSEKPGSCPTTEPISYASRADFP